MSKEISRGSMVIFIVQTPHVRPLLPLTTNGTWTEGYKGKDKLADKDTPKMYRSVSDLSRYLQILSLNISFFQR